MKSKLFFVMLLSATVAFTGCQNDEIDTPKEEITSKKHTIKIHASKGVNTKTTVSAEDGAYVTAWEKGDQISILEMVTGVSTDSELDRLEDMQGFYASAPLEEGGPTATFEATFDDYYWSNDDLSTYTFNYSYVAATTPNYMLVTMLDENDDLYLPVYFPSRQIIGKDSFSTECDLMVSNFSSGYSCRPEEVEFHFARLGSIVKITVGGLQAGDVIDNGAWYTGDKFLPAFDMEAVLFYYPEKGEYKYELPEYLVEMITAESHRVEFEVDTENPIVVGADGTADIYLRALPGEISDWFMLSCNITRDGEQLTYSKYVSLADLGRSLTFKDSGLTKFSVELKEATVSNPEDIIYTVPSTRDSFMAVWEKQEGVAKYECFYSYDNYEEGEGREIVELDCIEQDGMVFVQAENLKPGRYYLGVLAVPDSQHGPISIGYSAVEIYVGVPMTLMWYRVEYNDGVEFTQLSDSLWMLVEEGSMFPWVFEVSNVRTEWGWLIGEGQWSFATSLEMQHIGQLQSLTINLSTSANVPTVYGLTPEGTMTEITNPEVVPSDEYNNWYTFDFESAGYFNGFKISGSEGTSITTFNLSYYAPTGEEEY